MQTKLQQGDALIIVDPQVDFFPGGALPVADGHTIIPVINYWIDAALAAHLPIVASRDWHPRNHCSFKEQGGPWPVHCVQHTPGAQFHPELKLPAITQIIDTADDPKKEAYSAFHGNTLDGEPMHSYLQSQNVKRLWVMGLAQDYCVCETALDGRANGYIVHLVLSGTRPITQETGNQALEKMRAAGVIIEGPA